MKDQSRIEWARRLLEDQIARLAELRNANPRDPGFKLWRQTTLTVVQRIWPGDIARCERFRRVPFSPTSPKASRSQIKEHYERGCAEAGAYLRTLMTEIGMQGVRPASSSHGPMRLSQDLAEDPPRSADASHASDPYEPSPLERIKPFVPPPREEQPVPHASEPEPEPAAEPEPEPTVEPEFRAPFQDRRALKEMLGFVDDPRTPAAPRAPASQPQAPAPPPPPQARRPEPDHDSFLPPRPAPAFTGFDDLIDEHSEEFADESDAELDEPMEETTEREVSPPPPPRAPQAPSVPEIDFLSRVNRPATPPSPPTPAPTAARAPAPPPRPAPAPESPRPPAPEKAPTPARASAPAPAPAPAPSPIAAPAPRMAEPAPDSAVEVSPAAAAFTALAAEVARLGVPEGHRAAARAALLDMARRIDDGSANWDSICQILTMAAAYPRVARRALPLLVPFLEIE